ncbi:MAG: HlyD family secretion protein [Pseudomonadota bacterium]|nr:HlyD family secretion protein [Pseudomonadota bacterium]
MSTIEKTESAATKNDQDMPQSAEKPAAAPELEPKKTADPVRRFTWIVLAMVVLLFVWYVLADRNAPWTDQARVQAWIVPISPKVSGKVIEVNVVQDQLVKAGDLLVRIDPRDYELAVQKAEADLDLAGQDIGASTEHVAVAEASLAEDRTQLAFYQAQADRYLKLADSGTISKSEADQTRSEVAKAEARVKSAEAELAKAEDQLGAEGEDNAKIRAAIAALEQARIDLAETSIYAPTDGGITNLKIEKGYYANEGTPLMTFVSFSDIWLQANIRENSIGNIKPGDRVEIALDMVPGKVFQGKVFSRGFAVDHVSGGAAGEAATIEGDSGWLRDAQRFPVIIHFADDSARGYRFAGGQADVQIYTGDHAILNALGGLWIRLMSWLSYVY